MVSKGPARVLATVLTERQFEGAAHLRQALSGPQIVLVVVFLAFYGGYWASVLSGVSEEIPAVLEFCLGALLAGSIILTLIRLWPRVEPVLPRPLRSERPHQELPGHHRHIFLALLVVATLAMGLFVAPLTYLVIATMGIIGGVFILHLAEDRLLMVIGKMRSRRSRLWRRGGWSVLSFLVVLFFVLAFVTVAVAVTVGSNEREDHTVLLGPTLVVVTSGIALAIEGLVLAVFTALMSWRGLMKYRARRGKIYGPRRQALMDVHPVSLAIYIGGVNFITALFFFFYALLTTFQVITQAQARTGHQYVDWSGLLVPSGLIDIAALMTFVIAWAALLVNLSASANRTERRYMNRHVFAAVSVVAVMVVFMHVIVARGDELTVSILFRGAYLVGLAIAPLIVFWRRWSRVTVTLPDKDGAKSADRLT